MNEHIRRFDSVEWFNTTPFLKALKILRSNQLNNLIQYIASPK